MNSISRSKWPVIVSTKQDSSNAAFVPVDYSSNTNYVKSGQSGYTEIGTLDNSNNATIDKSGGSNMQLLFNRVIRSLVVRMMQLS